MFDFSIADIDLIQYFSIYFSMVFDLYIFPTILLLLLVLVKVILYYDLARSEMKAYQIQKWRHLHEKPRFTVYCLIFSPGPILSILSYHTHNLIDEIFSVTCRL